jgi:CTP:molybdopterin cytidylyltransferase MocA
MHNTGIIILAAGASSRLGQPKQLLEFNGESFIRRMAKEAASDNSHAVVAVIGANNDSVTRELDGLDILLCHNESWQQGMGSSINAGLKHLLLVYPDIHQCVICVCDQPFVDDTILQALNNEQLASGRGIIASSYAGTLGVPVLFTRPYFDALLHLQGQEGAKKLVDKYSSDVSSVPFEKGAIDIDTIDDYNQLKQQE